jgi:riboflavin biosynthesis pyrimidine reductase
MYAVAAPGVRQVRVNFVTSLDGAIEVDGRSNALSSEADKEVFRTLRGLADVILVGQSTAMGENYGPVGTTTSGHRPPIAISALTPKMDPESAFFADAVAKPFLLVPDDADTAAYENRAEIIRCGHRVSYPRALDALAEVGLTRVLCEGGPRVFSDLLVAGLVDEVCLTIAPTLAGPGHANLLGGNEWSGSAQSLALQHLLEDDGFLFTRWSTRP